MSQHSLNAINMPTYQKVSAGTLCSAFKNTCNADTRTSLGARGEQLDGGFAVRRETPVAMCLTIRLYTKIEPESHAQRTTHNRIREHTTQRLIIVPTCQCAD